MISGLKSRARIRAARPSCSRSPGFSAEPPHRRGEVVDIAGLDQQAVDSIGDDLGGSAGGRRNHRKPGGHSLHDHLPERLGDRGRVHQHIGVGEFVGHLSVKPHRSMRSSR